MSQYNKTVLTNAGLELAKRANAGQARFEITRAVTSADDWSSKTIQDIEAVTTIPNIMQQGTIMDTEEVESNNSVMGVSLCFTNKNLSAGYQIKIIGVYVKEEGQENDFLYAVTTAITPEYMPDFSDKILYRFNMQLYLVIGKAQAVNVVINDGASVTHKQFDNYKKEVTANLEKIENAHKEDMSHVVKSASINGGDEILPDEAGKLELVVPAPDLSKYVSLEQLGELLKTKADKADVYTKTETDNQINKFDLSKVKFRNQYLNGDGQAIDKTWSATKNDDGTYTIDLYNDDWTALKLADVLEQLPSKADTSTVNAQITDAKNTIKSDIDNLHNDLQNQVNAKLNKTDTVNVVNSYDVNNNQNGGPNKWPVTQAWYVDQTALRPFADQINQLKGRRQVDTPDFNNLTDTGTYYVSNPRANAPTGSWGNLLVSNGAGHRTSQMYFPDDGSALYMRELDETTWHGWIQLATTAQVSDLQNQIQQLRDNQFEVQTFTDANAAANWEAQKPGKRMAIVNS